MHKENFLFLIRVISGELGLHQKSETRTKKHHQRRPKPFRKKAYQKQHIQAETHLSQLQLWKEAKSSEATIIWIRSMFRNHQRDLARKRTIIYQRNKSDATFIGTSDYLDDFFIGIRRKSKNHRDDQSRKSHRQIPTKRIDWSLRSEEAWGAINHKNTKKQHLHRQYAPPVLPEKAVDHNA